MQLSVCTYLRPNTAFTIHYDSFPITQRTLYPSKDWSRGGRKKKKKKSKDRRPETLAAYTLHVSLYVGCDPDQAIAPPNRGSSCIFARFSAMQACLWYPRQHSHRGECPKHFVNHEYANTPNPPRSERDLPLTDCLLFNRALAVRVPCGDYISVDTCSCYIASSALPFPLRPPELL